MPGFSSLRSYSTHVCSRTQYEYYATNTKDEHILSLARISNAKAYGSWMEKIHDEALGLVHDFSDTRWDSLDQDNKRVEQKSARFGGGDGDIRNPFWNHLKPEHPWDYTLLTFLNFQEIEVFYLSKEDCRRYVDEGLIKPQGRKISDSYGNITGSEGVMPTLNFARKYLRRVAVIGSDHSTVDSTLFPRSPFAVASQPDIPNQIQQRELEPCPLACTTATIYDKVPVASG